MGAVLALLLASTSQAKNLHVATTGDDKAAGTLAKPYASLAKAAQASAPGDTILVRGGTYKLTAQLDPKSGTSETSRITYKAYPGETAVVDGQAGYCLTLANKAYLTFDGLQFTTADTAVGAGMVYFENTRHIVFQNCGFSGMPAERGSENTAVIRCMSTGYPDAANVENSDSCVFRNNHFRDNASPALRLYDTKGWVIENNTFTNCLQAVGGKDEPYDMLVRRNLIVGGDLAFYFPMQGGGNGVTITENIVVNSGGGMMIGGLGTYNAKRQRVNVYNNTFYNVRSWFFGWSEAPFDTLVAVWNNIVHADVAANIPGGEDIGSRFICMSKYQSTPMETPDYSFDFNDYSMPASDRSTAFIDGRVGYADLGAWRTARPFDAHSFSSAPFFVNASASDFHLQTASPCKGVGKSGEDLGAYPRGNDGTVIGQSPASSVSIRTRSSPRGERFPKSSSAYLANGRTTKTAGARLANDAVVAPIGR